MREMVTLVAQFDLADRGALDAKHLQLLSPVEAEHLGQQVPRRRDVETRKHGIFVFGGQRRHAACVVPRCGHARLAGFCSSFDEEGETLRNLELEVDGPGGGVVDRHARLDGIESRWWCTAKYTSVDGQP